MVFRFEVAIERHLVGLGGRGDLIDAHAHYAARIEQLSSHMQDGLARGSLLIFSGLFDRLQNLLVMLNSQRGLWSTDQPIRTEQLRSLPLDGLSESYELHQER